MQGLTDNQYNELEKIANDNNIRLCGYQVKGNLIDLNNSKKIIIGETMAELIEKLKQ